MSSNKALETNTDSTSSFSESMPSFYVEQKLHGMHYISAQQLIDKEIGALKRLRNDLAPVSRLPPELLCRIFKFVQTAGSRGYYYDYGNDLRKWVKLTYVSQKWRNTALHCPSLWANIVVDGPWRCWEKEAIKRVKMVPLILTILASETQLRENHPKTQTKIQATLLRDIFPKLSQTKKISIRAETGALASLLTKMPPTSFPLLQSLHISANEYPRPLELTTWTLSKKQWKDAPFLQDLRISQFTIDWELPWFSGLVHFTLVDIPIAQRPSLTDIFLALEKSTCLESLTLRRSLPTSAEYSSSFTPSRVTYLPRLTKFSLKSPTAEVAIFLRHLTFPNRTSIEIECDGQGSLASEQLPVLSRLSWLSHSTEFESHSTAKPTRYLKLKGTSYDKLSIEAWQSLDFSDSIVKMPTNGADAVVILDCNPRLNLPPALSGLFLQSLECLWISTVSVDSTSWKTIFGGLINLSYIHLEEIASSLDGLLDAMAPVPSRIGDCNEKTCILPSLRHISLNNFPFIQPQPGLKPLGLPIEKMEKCLLNRREQNTPIRSLILQEGCDIELEDVEKMKQVVTHFEWDEKACNFRAMLRRSRFRRKF